MHARMLLTSLLTRMALNNYCSS